MKKEYFVYIATNKNNTVFYTGMTSNISKRMYEHKSKLLDGFTKKYKISKLVYLEIFETPLETINAEKKIKGWLREKKIELIKSKNPQLNDLLA